MATTTATSMSAGTAPAVARGAVNHATDSPVSHVPVCGSHPTQVATPARLRLALGGNEPLDEWVVHRHIATLNLSRVRYGSARKIGRSRTNQRGWQ